MKMLNFGLSGLVEDASGNVYDDGLPGDTGSFDSGFAGDPGAVAGDPGPLNSTVYMPAGMDPDEAIAEQSAGMVPGESRVFVTPDGASETVVAVESEPAVPNINTLYKIGSQIYRYVMQPDAAGGARLVKKPIARSSSSGATPILLGLAALFFLS